MITIKEYLENLKGTSALAKKLGISPSMVGVYRKGKYNASLKVAKAVYKLDGTVLHPFAEESLLYEIEKENY